MNHSDQAAAAKKKERGCTRPESLWAFRNFEGYSDSTAGKALERIYREEMERERASRNREFQSCGFCYRAVRPGREDLPGKHLLAWQPVSDRENSEGQLLLRGCVCFSGPGLSDRAQWWVISPLLCGTKMVRTHF